MADYPLVYALVQELCELSDEEMSLPFELLVNVHRGTLRKPLETLGALSKVADSGEAALNATDLANEIWPALAHGEIFARLYDSEDYDEAQEARVNVLRGVAGLGLSQLVSQFSEGKPVLRELLDAATSEWCVHEPLVVLHELTWGTDIMEALLPLMEAELGVSPVVSSMILTLADL